MLIPGYVLAGTFDSIMLLCGNAIEKALDLNYCIMYKRIID
jgi:hypothetical protein